MVNKFNVSRYRELLKKRLIIKLFCNELKFLKFKFVLIQITTFLQNFLNLLHK